MNGNLGQGVEDDLVQPAFLLSSMVCVPSLKRLLSSWLIRVITSPFHRSFNRNVLSFFTGQVAELEAEVLAFYLCKVDASFRGKQRNLKNVAEVM